MELRQNNNNNRFFHEYSDNIAMSKNHRNDDNNGNYNDHDYGKTMSDRSYSKRQHKRGVKTCQRYPPKYLHVVKKCQVNCFFVVS